VAENLAPKRRADNKAESWQRLLTRPQKDRLQADKKPEPWWPKTWPQKGEPMTKLSLGGFSHGTKKTDYKPIKNLNLGGRKPGPKKASR
jgi:hypothetical protein